MKRDNDALREILLEFEQTEDWSVLPDYTHSNDPVDRLREGHLMLLCDSGLIVSVGKYSYRLTSAGHDFLQAMRDEGVWQRTKQVVAESGGNATLDIVKQLAVGFLKKKIRDHTDIDF